MNRTTTLMTALLLTACAAHTTGNGPAINEPHTATSFYCGDVDVRGGETCSVSQQRCDADVAKAVAAANANDGTKLVATACKPTPIAWCFVSAQDNAPAKQFGCAPTRSACGQARTIERTYRDVWGFGECVERTAGR